MDEVMDETFGLGPLEALLKDPTISDILVNRLDRRLRRTQGPAGTDAKFASATTQHLRQIIDRIVGLVGRRVDETSPMVDARLADGSRVNAIIPPLALDGPAMSIRRFGSKPLQVGRPDSPRRIPAGGDGLSLGGGAGAVQHARSAAAPAPVKRRCSTACRRYIPPDERVITIEDAAELQLQQPHVVRLETRPPNIEGKGEVTQRDLVKNCLRMRPDRIIIGEVPRPARALDMLQAMNTGHEGSMTTIHANNARDAPGPSGSA